MQTEAWDRIAKMPNFNLEIDMHGFTEIVSKEAKILDYGCGYGRISEQLYTNGYDNVVGVDSSGEMIKRGRIEHPHLCLHQTQSLMLDYADDVFDAVVVCAVFTCLPEQQQKSGALKEIARVLRPGGILHVVEFCNNSNITFESKLGVVMHHQKPQQLREFLSVFDELSFIINETQTMSGDIAKAVCYFGKST